MMCTHMRLACTHRVLNLVLFGDAKSKIRQAETMGESVTVQKKKQQKDKK